MNKSTTQMTFFEELLSASNLKNEVSIKQSTVADVRTEGQLKREVAYDVGEKIGGARKDLEANRAAFLMKPDLRLLQEIEDTDISAAADVIKRDTFLNEFTFEDCKQRNVIPGVAKAIQLFINRLPKEAADTKEGRIAYAKTMLIISSLLKGVQTKEDYYRFEKLFYSMLVGGNATTPKRVQSAEEHLALLESRIDNSVTDKEMDVYYAVKGDLFLFDFSRSLLRIGECGPQMFNYFYKNSSRTASLRKAFAIKEWDELLVKKENTKAKGQTARKPVWERALPVQPTRSGGNDISISDPEDYVETFGFRASEFGHYVGDDRGLEHIQSSAEAYMDLKELLQIPTKSVSLGGELAMAFGSRGRGRALGHYEPARKVINLTKKNGSLGILAHEWFHSLDHFLYSQSYDFENGKVGFLTELTHGANLPDEVIVAVKALIQGIKVGESTMYVDVSNCSGRYVINSSLMRRYKNAGGNLDVCLRNSIIDFDENVESWLNMYAANTLRYDQQKSKFDRKRARYIKTTAEALAQYHFNETGEKVNRIGYPVYHSCFYQCAVELDKGSEGKYWSSNVELAARAFEFYIEGKLMDNGWKSDYLVCGIDGKAYPEEDCERERIFDAVEAFVEAIRPLLSEC